MEILSSLLIALFVTVFGVIGSMAVTNVSSRKTIVLIFSISFILCFALSYFFGFGDLLLLLG